MLSRICRSSSSYAAGSSAAAHGAASASVPNAAMTLAARRAPNATNGHLRPRSNGAPSLVQMVTQHDRRGVGELTGRRTRPEPAARDQGDEPMLRVRRGVRGVADLDAPRAPVLRDLE